MTEAFRKPAVFSADDPRIVLAPPEEAPRERNALTVSEMTDVAPAGRPRRVRWGALFWSALSGLVMLGLGIAITNFVEQAYDISGVELFEQQVIPAFIEQEPHGNLWHFMHGR